MEWWDHITWQELLTQPATTMTHIPDALSHAIATLRTAVCQEIESTAHTPEADRAWELLLALDLLLFGVLRDKSTAHSKRQQITDRMDLIQAGQWSSLWYQTQPEHKPDADQRPELTARSARVQSLIEAGEIGRAANAVWGMLKV